MAQKTNHGEVVARTSHVFVCWDGSALFEVWKLEAGIPVKHLYTFEDTAVGNLQAAKDRAQEWIGVFGVSTEVLINAGML